MKPNALHNPHDVMFKKVFGRRETAEEFMKNFLPAALTEGLSYHDMTLDRTVYADEKLKEKFADVVWTLHDQKNESLKVVFLLEHKSNRDKHTAFQVLEYIVRIWAIQLKVNKMLSPVIPIIVYQGKDNWVPQTIPELIPDLKDDLRPYIPDFKMYFHNMIKMTDAELSVIKNQVAYLQLNVIASARNEDRIKKALDTILEANLDLTDRELRNIFDTFIVYVNAILKDKPYIEKKLDELPPSEQKNIMKSVSQQYIEEGIQLGKQEGIQIGKQEGIQLGKQEGIQIGEQQGLEKGIQLGEKNGEHKASLKFATFLIKTTDNDDKKIAELTDLDIKEVVELRKQILDQQSK